jgi:hypothetical protein
MQTLQNDVKVFFSTSNISSISRNGLEVISSPELSSKFSASHWTYEQQSYETFNFDEGFQKSTI